MDWRVVKHTESTDGKTEHITCELWVNFPKSRWNDKEESPVIKIMFSDRKYSFEFSFKKGGSDSFIVPPSKNCVIQFTYFQRQTEIKLNSDHPSTLPYDEFTLDYCKEYATTILKERINDVLKQL
jgi:hypothetical protein